MTQENQYHEQKGNLVPTEEATAGQICKFLDMLSVPYPRSYKDDKSKLLIVLENAQLGRDGILVLKPIPKQTTAIIDEWDEKKERWCLLQILPENLGAEEDAPAYVGINDEFMYIPRNKLVVIRERFYRHLSGASFFQTIQFSASDGDEVAKKYKDAKRFEVPLYPHSFKGTVGFVSDGPPPAEMVPHNAVVMEPLHY